MRILFFFYGSEILFTMLKRHNFMLKSDWINMFHLGFLQNHQAVPVSLKRFKTWASKKIWNQLNYPITFFLQFRETDTLKLGSNSIYQKNVKVSLQSFPEATFIPSLLREHQPSWLSLALTWLSEKSQNSSQNNCGKAVIFPLKLMFQGDLQSPKDFCTNN